MKEPVTWRLEKQDLERQVKDLKKKIDDISIGDAKKVGATKLRRQASDENSSKDSSPARKSEAEDFKKKLDDVSNINQIIDGLRLHGLHHYIEVRLIVDACRQ